MDVFDFKPGDEIHVEKVYTSDAFSSNFSYENKRSISSFISRIDYPDSIVYEVERKIPTAHRAGFAPLSYEYVHDTITTVINPSLWFDELAGEPEIDEWSMGFNFQMFAYYIYDGLAVKVLSNLRYEHVFESDCWNYPIYDGPSLNKYYYQGLGGPYYSRNWAFNSDYRTLEFFKKGDTKWGTPLDLTASSTKEFSAEVARYPNPAHHFVKVRLPYDQNQVYFNVFDLTWRMVLMHLLNDNETTIDVSRLKAGIYIYRLMKDDKSLGSGKLIVQ